MIQEDDGGDPFNSARGERRDAAYAPAPRETPREHRDAYPVRGSTPPPQGTIQEHPAEADLAPASSYSRVVTDDEPVYANKCARIFVLVLAGIFAAAGMAIAILGRIELDHKVLPICPDCSNFATAMYIVGSCVAVFGLLGIAAAATRFKPLAFFYAFLLFLLAVLCFACGVAIVVFELGLKKSEVRRVWVQEVSDERQVLCDLQQKLECSGFDHCCGVIDVAQPISPSNTYCNITSAVYLQQCDDRCTESNQKYRESCDERVTDLIKAHFKPLVGVAFGLSVTLMVGTVMSVRMALSSVPAAGRLTPNLAAPTCARPRCRHRGGSRLLRSSGETGRQIFGVVTQLPLL
eukprot:CAMPEP_0174832838 /NCGR_PEP_ID=MMETSP1114-20130205/3885_1 /TAXON_ID=312471 /ORGANISM="Neobodo designis, Strain CCAP 1951/1" /LENGTH=348 /DNA_ID=CAMNT_0016066705 /DNA_START=33 /DNA_END=1077 /DNA_ORIENTATION=+